MNILFLGYNSFRQHKRGVENVIDFQSKACDFERIYYLHWGSKTTAYKNNKFTCLSIKHCWYWPLLLNLVLFKIKRENKFITHSHNPLFSFFSVFHTDILTVHDGLYYLNKSMKRKIIFQFRIIELLLYFRCTLIHFISNYTKEQSLFGNRRNFVIIPNTSHFENFASSFNSNKNTPNKKNILIVRSIEERARIDLILQVAERLSEKNYIFSVAGKGPLLLHYQKEIEKRKLKNIEMLGYVNDNELLHLYSNCNIVLMIAEYGEGFGLPIIEGYLFNKPVIASKVCAIPEIIIDNSFLFENNVEDILEKIDFALNQVNQDYRKFYFEKFGNKNIVFKFCNLYKSCLTK